MASATPAGSASGGRRRSLDAEINLVPFIDLLSMCICFLLITAVWVSVDAVQLKQSHGTESATPDPNQLKVEARFGSSTEVEFIFKRGSRIVQKRVVKSENKEGLGGAIDAGLALWPETRLAHPQADSPVFSATIYPKAGVSYGDLVVVMDALRKHRIASLGVAPTGGV
jgi:biopolymer transport protein TolR